MIALRIVKHKRRLRSELGCPTACPERRRVCCGNDKLSRYCLNCQAFVFGLNGLFDLIMALSSRRVVSTIGSYAVCKKKKIVKSLRSLRSLRDLTYKFPLSESACVLSRENVHLMRIRR
jgi:hypothetical protein